MVPQPQIQGVTLNAITRGYAPYIGQYPGSMNNFIARWLQWQPLVVARSMPGEQG